MRATCSLKFHTFLQVNKQKLQSLPTYYDTVRISLFSIIIFPESKREPEIFDSPQYMIHDSAHKYASFLE